MLSASKLQPGVNEKTLNTLPVAVILYDNKAVYFINNKARLIFKIPKNRQNKQISIFDFLDKKEHSKIKRDNKAILQGKLVSQTELEFKNFKNEPVFIEVSCGLVIYKGKKLIQAVFTEISERRNRNLESEKAKDLLHKISTNSQDVIFHFGFTPGRQLKFISNSSRNVLGYSPTQLYANPDILKKGILPEDKNKFATDKAAYLKKGKATRQKTPIVRFKHKNGKIKYLEVAINPVLNAKKELVGLVGNMRDITDRKETETLLVETKEKFDLITNYSNEIIAFYTFLPKEKYLYVSPNIEKILGYKPIELLKDNMFFKRRAIEKIEEFDNADKILLEYQQKNIFKSHSYYYRTYKKNKEEVWLENNFVPVLNREKKISFFIYILKDITKQKEKEIEIELQYTNYRNLLDNSPVAYVIHDQGVVLYVNNALMNLLKIKSKNQILGKFTLEFFKEKDRKRLTKMIARVYENKTATKKFIRYNISDLEGNVLDIEVKSVLIKFNNKDCVLSLVSNLSEQQQRESEKQKVITIETANALLQKEIKERKEAEKNLTEKTAHLSSIFESSTHLLWTVNREYKVTSYNKNFADVVRLQNNIEITPGCKIDELLKENRQKYIDLWYTHYDEAFEGKKLEFEKEDFNEGKVFWKIFINPIYNEWNEISEISCIANDITDSKIYEQKLLNQTGKLTAIFDSSHHYIWTISREERLTSFNKNYYDLVTALYNTKPYVGLVLDRGVLANDKEYTMLLKYHYNRAFNGIATSFEIETRDQEFKNVYLEIFLNPIFENEFVVEVSGIAHNITDKKHVQQKMEVSLKEKEILLREVHHRVKNNMQVISSILNLQSSYVSDEYTLNLLKESQNRIKTMAYIHESLYQNKSFTSVNFSDYVHTLVNNIVQSYSYSGDKIKLEINIQDMTLSLDSSIPAGLIINELITNAIKHAFPGPRKGTITFNLRCENNLVILELKDDGVGFAQGIDFENSHSLGLQLVNTLTEQIEGKIDFKSEENSGTEVKVTFKM